MITDWQREYFEEKFLNMERMFSGMTERLERIENIAVQNEREIAGAKLLGRAAIGVAAMVGGFTTWAVDIIPKISHLSR